MSDTAVKILHIGEELIQTRGYTAMIIRQYRDTFASQLEAIKSDPHRPTWEALDF